MHVYQVWWAWPFGFRDFALFLFSLKFPFWIIAHGVKKESAQKVHASRG